MRNYTDSEFRCTGHPSTNPVGLSVFLHLSGFGFGRRGRAFDDCIMALGNVISWFPVGIGWELKVSPNYGKFNADRKFGLWENWSAGGLPMGHDIDEDSGYNGGYGMAEKLTSRGNSPLGSSRPIARLRNYSQVRSTDKTSLRFVQALVYITVNSIVEVMASVI